MQDFLANKLKLKNNVGVLSDKYLSLWGDKEKDDSLDEMTVILGRKRQIDLNKKVYIGETRFLREYYKDKSIISWSHESARDLKLWERMRLLLSKDYVTQILSRSKFGLKKSKIALQSDPKKDDKNFSTIGQQPISQLFNKLLRKAESQKPLCYKENLSFPQFPQALLTLLRL